MIFQFKNQFPKLNAFWDKYAPYQKRLEIPAKTILLEEGSVSQHAIYIEKGCLRAFLNKNGEDKTVQFFFEEEGLTGLESFTNRTPSLFTIETIEPSVVYLLHRKYVLQLLEELSHEPDFVQMVMKITAKRLTHYSSELASFIRDTPEQRYRTLTEERPHIIQRVSQHYIASYLGVSSVHLSRIRNKVAKGKTHF